MMTYLAVSQKRFRKIKRRRFFLITLILFKGTLKIKVEYSLFRAGKESGST
jgi:predicted hydrocarbon binding protein